MSTNKLTAVIERVQKLLALSKSSNVHEAAAAAAKANKLIDEHRLSEADLNTSDDPLKEDDGYIYETGRIIPWKADLVRVLAKHYGCAWFNDNHFPIGANGRPRKVSRYKLIGRTSDINIVRYMYAWLTTECQRLADIEAKGSGHVYVFSYCNGFVQGIREQLEASRKEAQQHATSSAIVKIDSRYDESKAFMDSNHKLIYKKQVSKSHVDLRAFQQGKKKGESLHLGASIGTGDKPKLLR